MHRRHEELSQQEQLNAARRSYKKAAEVGNREEEARWSNFIANIYKNLGEYVQALRWLRIDYKVSKEHLPEKQLLATCQSMGELYLRLEKYDDALEYQEEHLKIATDANDLVEQQRASTQLGRTYHEIFLKSEDDHSSIRNANKYFKSAMKLAQTIKERAVSERGSFLKEYIDAHNNLGMIEIDRDNLTEAEKILTEGLRICDEEEVAEYDDARTRLHHNLGNIYLELRKWEEARKHIVIDIKICRNIGHYQGEAKGYINLGELYYRTENYGQAILSYQKAFELAKSLEDEDALAKQSEQNIDTVEKAKIVVDELKKEEQNLKKLERNWKLARGTDAERKCLKKLNSCLDNLIEKSRMILSWTRLGTYAKKKMSIARELCDKEKLGDSFLVIGESYEKLRHFKEALEWNKKSLETYKSIGNLEGQALAKINIGDVLDSIGDHMGALVASKEAYKIADCANLPSAKLSALENIHYSHMIRFDDVEEATKTKLLIDQLKQSKVSEFESEDLRDDRCSETETELHDHSSDDKTDCSSSPKSIELNSARSKCNDTGGDWNEDIPLRSLLKSNKKHARKRAANGAALDAVKLHEFPNQSIPKSMGDLAINRKRPRVILSDDNDEEKDEEVYCSEWMVGKSPVQCNKKHARKRATNGAALDAFKLHESPNQSIPKSTGGLAINRKRPRVILSDDDDEEKDEKVYCSEWMVGKSPVQCTTSSDKSRKRYTSNQACEVQGIPDITSSCPVNASLPATTETSISSYKSNGSSLNDQNVKDFKFTGTCSTVRDSRTHGNIKTTSVGSSSLFHDEISTPKCHASCEDHCKCVVFKVDADLVHMSPHDGCKLSLEQMKVELACFYYLRLSIQKKSRGLVPVIQHLMHGGRILESMEDLYSIKDHATGSEWIDVSISEMVLKHVMKLYIDCCDELSEPPSMEVIKKLYNLEVPDDEIVVSGCKLQDISVAPLLNALQLCKRIAVLDLSHNQLGNETVEKLKEVFVSVGQSHGGLVLNLHNNRLGSTALDYISECPAIYARLEVLNMSGNRLTDNCASYLSTILKTCKALYSLDLENCSIASRTINVIAGSLKSESVLSHLCLGYNDRIPGNSLSDLLQRLATLRRFQELNLNGIKISKNVIYSLCQLAKDCCLSGLMLGSTYIGTESAMKLIKSLSIDAHELAKFDLSYCELTCDFVVNLKINFSLICGLHELNLSGNPLMEEGGNSLATILSTPQCNLRILSVSKCKLGLVGIIRIIQSLLTNSCLQELYIAENITPSQTQIESIDQTGPTSETFDLDTNVDQLEVPDSEELLEGVQSGLDDICSSQKRIHSPEFHLTEELIASIKMAGELKLLDLSSNGFAMDVVETLFLSWRSGSRAVYGKRHTEEDIVHFFVQGLNCCGVKPCCRRI